MKTTSLRPVLGMGLFSLGSAIGVCLSLHCSLLVPVDGLGGLPRDDGDVPNVPASDASLRDADARRDASVAEVLDAGALLDGATRFCPQLGAIFCADFDDEDASLPAPFDGIGLRGGVIALSKDRWASSPRAMRVETGGTGTERLHANAYTSFAKATHIVGSFDVYIEVRGLNLNIAWLDLGNHRVFVSAADEVASSIVEELDGGSAYDGTTGRPFLASRWTRVELELDIPTRVTTLRLDGAQVASRTLEPVWATLSEGTFSLGAPSVQGTRVYYDNIALVVR